MTCIRYFQSNHSPLQHTPLSSWLPHPSVMRKLLLGACLWATDRDTKLHQTVTGFFRTVHTPAAHRRAFGLFHALQSVVWNLLPYCLASHSSSSRYVLPSTVPDWERTTAKLFNWNTGEWENSRREVKQKQTQNQQTKNRSMEKNWKRKYTAELFRICPSSSVTSCHAHWTATACCVMC